MAESYWPFDGVDTSETQYSQLFRRMQATGVWGSDTDTAVKLVQGSGLGTALKSGYALVRGHMYYNDADWTVAFTAGGATARVDLVVLRLDPTANTIKAVVLPGSPGAGVAPAPTQTDAGVYEMPIAKVAIGANSSSITNANITDVRPFMGHIFGDWTTANRPVNPREGQPGYNLTTNRPEYWNGTDWVDFSPSSFTISQISDLGTATVANALKINGRQIFVQSGTPTGMAAGDLWFW
jgi:hypothetical protein